MRSADGLKGIEGLDYVASVPSGETIRDMAVVDNQLFIATDKHIYRLADEKRLELADNDLGVG